MRDSWGRSISVAASSTAFVAPVSRIDRFLTFALILPFGLVFAIISKRQSRVMSAALVLFFISLTLESSSCGGSGSAGGGGGNGGGGSNNYTITVTATATGTNATRTLGTVNVTVTH